MLAQQRKLLKEHHIRCEKGQVMFVYHQTSPKNASKILKSNFKLSTRGLIGPGIYFAATPKATNHKASNKGSILKCKAKVGNILIAKQSVHYEDRLELYSDKKDTVRVTYTNGDEYIVFDPKQIFGCKSI